MKKTGRPVKKVPLDFILLDAQVKNKQMSVLDACKKLDIFPTQYYKWRRVVDVSTLLQTRLEQLSISIEEINSLIEEVLKVVE